jgi:hypothetical protein
MVAGDWRIRLAESGIIAGASALAGGIAVGRWYRKPLTKPHEAENHTAHPEFKNLEDDTVE